MCLLSKQLASPLDLDLAFYTQVYLRVGMNATRSVLVSTLQQS